MSELEPGGWKQTREGPSPKMIGAAVIGVILLLFVLQNTDEADVDFLFFSGSFPLWVIAVVVAGLAFAAGWLAGRSRARRRFRRAGSPDAQD